MSAALILPPIPENDPISQPKRERYVREKKPDPLEGRVTPKWIDFFTRQGVVIQQAAVSINAIQESDQSASIGATDMSGGGLTAGLYSLMFYARITRAATVSSSLTVTLNWTDRSASMSYSGAAITGNTVQTLQSEAHLIRIDSASPVRYSTTYASVGGTSMTYDLVVVLTRISA